MSSFDTTTPVMPPQASDTVLAAAAGAARYAPSLHNTQPWSWTVSNGSLRLFARTDRRLDLSDPVARLLTLSCGASLCYARAAIAAQGWRARVTRMPAGTRNQWLAEIVADQHIPRGDTEARLFRALMQRQTDRRPLSKSAPEKARLAEAARAAEIEGAHLHVLERGEVVDLAVAMAHADDSEAGDDAKQREIREWTHRGGGDDGIPDSTIPEYRGASRVRPRFPLPGRSGTMPTDSGEDSAAAYLILFSDEDTPLAWLRAGEALGYAWANLIQAGMAVMPLSSAVEQPATRAELYGVLDGIGHPLLVLRVGYPETPTGAPLTGREPFPSVPEHP